jgi:hypothetical protein
MKSSQSFLIVPGVVPALEDEGNPAELPRAVAEDL